MYWLLRMKILIGRSCCTAVDISCMVISTEASPAMSMTRLFGMRDLHADRRRQAVAHGAEAARGHPAVRLLEVEELRRPHLVLADLGGDVDVLVPGRRVEPLDRVLRHDDVAVLPVGEAVARAPAVDLRPPRLQRRLVDLRLHRLPDGEHVLEHVGDVADDRDVDVDVLVDRRRIDVDVDLASSPARRR